MTDYVPAQEVLRLAIRAESDAGLFDDDSQANQLGEKIADDIRECVDEHAIAESEVSDDDDGSDAEDVSQEGAE